MNVGSPDEAEALLRERLTPVGTEQVGLPASHGRVLGAPLLADRPSPAIDVSAMDGFAVRVADLGTGHLPVAGDSAIGKAPESLPAAACLRIVTGAPIPAGADAVIRREDVVDREGRIEVEPGVLKTIKLGNFIRRRGENGPAGTTIVDAGALVTPAVAGALAACGMSSVTVRRRLLVGLLTTGDEVLAVSETPQAWQLRDSNGVALGAMLRSLPIVADVRHEHAADDIDKLKKAAAGLLESTDVLFLTGGVSMGHRDFVPAVLGSLGIEAVFHKVAQRPGRPLLGGIGPRGQLVLGLPGNPVSVLVTARRTGMPLVQHLAGASPKPRPAIRLKNPDAKSIELWWHRLVRITPDGEAELVDIRGSGDVVGVARSDGFVEIPPGRSGAGPWPFYGWDA